MKKSISDGTPAGSLPRRPPCAGARPALVPGRAHRAVRFIDAPRLLVPALLALLALLVAASAPPALAQQTGIANTKHNLSSSGSGTVKANTESQICVFCHTPHAATSGAPAPLWNRELSNATYTPYTSNSLDAQTIFGALSQPGGSSKLCLSCHDGAMAIGTVGVLGGNTNVSVTMSGTDLGKMPAGPQGATSGFTRNLGVDLRNDHPISFTFNDTLAAADGELRRMDAQQRHPSGSGTVVGIRSLGFRPLLPLQPTGTAGAGQVQCTTCHDPHLDVSKFLRLNRFQSANPAGGAFIAASDQICLGCHDKLGTAWSQSSHASQTIADEVYKTDSANRREFPTTTQVWQAACLNCHDTHAVQGSRRLLREGVGGTTGGVGVGSFRTGSAATPNTISAVEQTCYQCHATSGESIIGTATGGVPDIKSDFSLLRHMPIATAEQKSGVESHDIKDRNFTEDRTTLGQIDINNRHAECTDCHNPHRVTRNSRFNLGGSDQRTHVPGGANGNLASGALRGAFGVEPNYGTRSFFALPSSYTEKVGDGGQGAATDAGSTWVTREYQVCLKCHSDYAYPDDNVYPNGATRPELGAPGTPSGFTTTGRNNYTRYTNQAREFQAPIAHQGAPGAFGTDAGAGSAYNAGNHRSWHPVIRSTGRLTSLRNNVNTNAWLAPWNTDIGNNTMHCTDCHGSNASGTTDPRIAPDNGVWGPHGSTNNFLLKRPYDSTTGSDNTGLCFRCHDYNRYGAPSSDATGRTGFATTNNKDGHWIHFNRIRKNLRCNWCHVAVPHGWKNKSFLANLNDIGAEAGYSGSREVATNGNADTYSEGPYYRNAKVKVLTFRQNTQWDDTDCGSANKTSTNLIANSQGRTANYTEKTGVDWMKATCSNPP